MEGYGGKEAMQISMLADALHSFEDMITLKVISLSITQYFFKSYRTYILRILPDIRSNFFGQIILSLGTKCPVYYRYVCPIYFSGLLPRSDETGDLCKL